MPSKAKKENAGTKDSYKAELNAPSGFRLGIDEVRDEGKTGEVKGPGAEWEGRHAEPLPDESDPLDLHEVRNEGEKDEVKGPGAEWELTKKGTYKNR